MGIRSSLIVPLRALVLGDANPSIDNIGSEHFHYVAAALSGVQQQRERQPLASAERPAAFELGDLRVCPRVIGAEPVALQASKWIVGADTRLNGVGDDPRQDCAG
jgi:hypothetical protein